VATKDYLRNAASLGILRRCKMPRLTRKNQLPPPGGSADPAPIDAATAKLWNGRSSTAAKAVRALEDATGKPICQGGLAEYFISEAHRRAALEEEPRVVAAPSAILALAALPRSHGDLDCCSVCLHGGGSADTEETLTLTCNHKVHKRCIAGWLAVSTVCPSCRAQVTRLEPYRYPTKTALRSTFLRERTEFIVDWSQVSWQPRLRCLATAPRWCVSALATIRITFALRCLTCKRHRF
jgi:hypothetical protein